VPHPVNLGNPFETNMLDLAETVLQLTGAATKIIFLPLPKDDPKRRRPDITVARDLLGWTPKIPLSLGLRRTIDWMSGQGMVPIRAPRRRSPACAYASSTVFAAD
jgi:nucleoside-diphosphate-sugar epimerase